MVVAGGDIVASRLLSDRGRRDQTVDVVGATLKQTPVVCENPARIDTIQFHKSTGGDPVFCSGTVLHHQAADAKRLFQDAIKIRRPATILVIFRKPDPVRERPEGLGKRFGDFDCTIHSTRLEQELGVIPLDPGPLVIRIIPNQRLDRRECLKDVALLSEQPILLSLDLHREKEDHGERSQTFWADGSDGDLLLFSVSLLNKGHVPGTGQFLKKTEQTCLIKGERTGHLPEQRLCGSGKKKADLHVRSALSDNLRLVSVISSRPT